MRPLRSFNPSLVDNVRRLPLSDALDRLEWHWKKDVTFKPVKDKYTERWHVSNGGQVIELLVTGEKWFVPSDEKGGGGAIDLVMYLAKLNFVDAVKRLTATK
jgi:hypothetical protein